ncbi:MAG: O-antigen ligase family protein [Patescibacteria group bacterium]|nr:O-antigen ligase family protein [Patescibacteria group bacterium]
MFIFDVPAGWLPLLNPLWWPINVLLIGWIIALGIIAYRKPAAGVAGIACSLPLYLARVRFGWLPTTALELALIAAVAAGGFRLWRDGALRSVPSDPLRWPATALLLAGTAALAWSPDLRAAAGLWRAYLVEPILVYAFARRALNTETDRRWVVGALLTSGLGVALAAIWQWFSGIGIAEPMWVPWNARRVTAWYTSPNAVGLYLGPMIALFGGWMLDRRSFRRTRIAAALITAAGLAAIAATKSAGTWLGISAAALTLGWFTVGRWRTAAIAGIAIAGILLTPGVRIQITAKIQNPSGQNRLSLWRGTVTYLTATPANFIRGAGIHGFPQIQETFRDPRRQEPLIYPHNIFLNFWLEYGLAGLLAAGWVAVRLARITARALRQAPDGIRLGALAALAAILAHGLVDVPYFKNDLAILTWLMVTLALPLATPAGFTKKR